jgi:hypothetical protein
MTYLPQSNDTRRPARLRLADVTPAVLRSPDGGCTTGELQVVSLSGGLLGLRQPLHQGSSVKLMFLTPTGPVLGAAEMLSPLTHTQQPFRFTGIGHEDLRRLQSTIQTLVYPKGDEDAWIEKYRAAVGQIEPPRSGFSRALLWTFTLGLLGLGTTVLVLHSHLIR